MQLFVLRPTFDFTLLESHETAVQKIIAAHQRSSDKNLLRVFGEYGEIHLPPSEHRIWSPHLSFSLDERNGKTIVHGRFAPRFEIWTFVWMGYMAFAMAAFFGFTLAYAQYMIGSKAWGLWLGFIALLLWILLIAVAHIGQQLSADQMHQLRRALDEFLQSAGLQVDQQ